MDDISILQGVLDDLDKITFQFSYKSKLERLSKSFNWAPAQFKNISYLTDEDVMGDITTFEGSYNKFILRKRLNTRVGLLMVAVSLLLWLIFCFCLKPPTTIVWVLVFLMIIIFGIKSGLSLMVETDEAEACTYCAVAGLAIEIKAVMLKIKDKQSNMG